MRFRSHSEKADQLAGVPLFQNLNKRELEHLCEIADEVDSKPGEVLMRQGGLARELVLVVEGAVRVEQNGTLIARRGGGEFLGELGLLDQKPRSATVITDMPSTLLVIHRDRFWDLVDNIPGVERKLLLALASRLREAQDIVE